MAKILFVTFYDSNCVGLRIISSYLEAKGHECKILLHEAEEGEVEKKVLEHPIGYQTFSNGVFSGSAADYYPVSEVEQQTILKIIKEFAPDSVGISTRSYLDDFCISFAQIIKKTSPNILIMAGGFGPTLSYEKYLNGGVDIVVRGDGEESSLEIADAIDSGTSWDNVANLAYKKNGNIICNPIRCPETELSKYPHPLYGVSNILHLSGSSVTPESFKAPEFGYSIRYNVLWGRGCVGTCSYCSGGYWRLFYKENGQTMPPRRMREVDDVIGELLKAKQAGFKMIGLMDEFLVAPAHIMRDFFQKYKEKIDLPFTAYVHPHIALNYPEILDLMIEAGLNFSTVGIQSGSETFSKDVYNRKYQNSTIKMLANALSSRGVGVNYHLIGANPLETDDDFDKTLNLIKELPYDVSRDSICYFYFTVFPKAPILEKFGNEIFKKRDVEKWLRNGRLVYLRTLLDDHDFEAIKDLSSHELQEHTYKVLLDYVLKGNLLGEDSLEGVIVNDPPKTFLDYVLKFFEDKKIYIWGTGGAYEKRKHLFSKINIVCAFDNSVEEGSRRIVDGITVCNPSELKQMEPRPVFLFSCYKKEIFKQVRSIHPEMPVF